MSVRAETSTAREVFDKSVETSLLSARLKGSIDSVVSSSEIGKKRTLGNLWGFVRRDSAELYNSRRGIHTGLGGNEVIVAGRRTQLDENSATALVSDAISQVCYGQKIEHLPWEEKTTRFWTRYQHTTRVESLGIEFVSVQVVVCGAYDDEAVAYSKVIVKLI